MKKILLLLIYCPVLAHAQVDWDDSSQYTEQPQWDNYSTSYMGVGSDNTPLLVTAIPYNGIHFLTNNGADGTPLNMTFGGSAYRFRSNLETSQQLYTYDSGAVYFLAPGIFSYNAKEFEFRVLVDDSIVIQPWRGITQFQDSSFQLNTFRKSFAFLGGFYTSWDHYVRVELRRKNESSLLANTAVYWKQIKPTIAGMYTAYELTQFLGEMKQPQASLHRKLPPGEEEVSFLIPGGFIKKEVLEYQLTRNNSIIIPWRPNESAPNYIQLRKLKHGNYILEVRFRKQRHNVTTTDFSIGRFWFQTWWFKLGVVIAALSIIAGFIFFIKFIKQRKRARIEKAKQEKMQLGLHSLYAQLNPHFMFNALSSIQGLINKNDINAANKYLSVFGNMLRSSLTNSEKTFIPLEQEISMIETYLELEKLRFNFDWRIDRDSSLSYTTIEIPPLFLQPLVENAVKHGIASMQQNGELRIIFEKRNQDMVICIRDNGRGFVAGEQKEGYGLKLTRDRIQLVNEGQQERSIKMNIDSTPGKGTNIELLFINWLA